MRVDTYTKTLLTIIALCLVWIAIGGPAWLAVEAQKPAPLQAATPSEVVIVGWKPQGQAAYEALNNRGLPVKTSER